MGSCFVWSVKCHSVTAATIFLGKDTRAPVKVEDLVISVWVVVSSRFRKNHPRRVRWFVFSVTKGRLMLLEYVGYGK